MAIVTAADISGGRTALDAVASRNKQERPRFLCIPMRDGSTKHVFKLDSKEKLYDLGFVENWRSFFQLARYPSSYRRFASSFIFYLRTKPTPTYRYETWPRINDCLLERYEALAREASEDH